MQKRLLLADDQLATREALTKFAQMKGYEVVSVTNGMEALRTLREKQFDAVITDLVMPDLNGVSVAEIMRLRKSRVPVIALTGLPPEDVVEFQQWFTKIYHKPVKAEELLSYIDGLCSDNVATAQT